jgi:hypothetical protein
MKNFLQKNWFQVIVIVLLVLCYIKLGEISDNAFYTADVVDSSVTRMSNMMEDYMNNIETNTQNTWQILDNSR